jgi:hypothetical protein
MHRKTKNKKKREKFCTILKIKMLYADNQCFSFVNIFEKLFSNSSGFKAENTRLNVS